MTHPTMADSSKAPETHPSAAQIPPSTGQSRPGDPLPDTNYVTVANLISMYRSCTRKNGNAILLGEPTATREEERLYTYAIEAARNLMGKPLISIHRSKRRKDTDSRKTTTKRRMERVYQVG
ncbi:hypothetical protein K3495_g13579 [Podosphaera aphanis]|nr:hypothetical protein K3495_g13579 [Podosphaera aphanis]